MRDYVKAIKDIGIFPGSDAVAGKTFLDIYQDARHADRTQFTGPRHGICKCSIVAGDSPRSALIARLDECWKEIGLCLACVKNVPCEEHPATQ